MGEEICLSLNKKELEVLLNSLELVKDFNNLPKDNIISNNLINKIQQCLQSYIDEDLTDQKEFSKQKLFEPVYNELMTLFNEAKEPITISINESIKYANSVFCKMLGYESKEEIMELGLFNLISERSLPRIKKLHDKRSKGEIVPNIHNIELKRADGRIISIECVHYCMPFNKSYFIISFYISLTRIKSLEKKLRKSEEKYRELYENAPNAYFSIGIDKLIKRCNTTASKLLGYSHKEFLQMNFFDLYAKNPDGLPKAEKIFQRILKGEIIQEEELVMKHENGNLIWISLSAKAIKNQSGEVIESHSIVININERKKKEFKSRFLSSAIEQCDEGVALSDLDGNLEFVNKAFAKMHGYTEQELIGKHLSIFHTLEQLSSVEMANECTKNEGFFLGEIWHAHKDGRIFPTQMHNSLLLDNEGNPTGMIATVRDITKQKQIKNALKESEQNFKDLIDNSPFGIILANKDGAHIFANKRAAEITGYRLEELIGMKGWDLTRPEDIKVLEERMRCRVKGEPHINVYERIIIRKDGKEIFTDFYTTTTIWKGDKTPMVCFQDTTESKKMEERLRESQLFLKNIFNAIQDGISVSDRDLNITHVNQWMEKIYATEKPLVNRKCYEVYQNRKTSCPWCPSIPAMEQGETQVSIVPYPSEDNPIGWIELTAFPLKNNEGQSTGVIEYVKDITARKKVELKLKESEEKYRNAYNREKFYKDLFAHDMNNILNNVISAAELMLLQLKGPEKMRKLESFEKLLDLVKNQGLRGAKLIDNVRKLSQVEESKISLKSMDTYKTLIKATDFTRGSSLKENINIQVESKVQKLFVEANELLFDVFENILNNAVKYNDNSQVEIVVKVSKVQKEKINYIKIEFMDNGIGIKDDRKELIFKRAYTKERSVHGMGFGLSLVKKIIESYNGEIWIEDRVKGEWKKGSNFIILIPEVV